MSRNALYFSFITPPNTGGDFIAIDHIAALNRLGFDAKALYLRNDLGYLNFPVPAVSGSLRLNQNDIIIIAETHKQIFEQVRSVDCVKVLNDQNPFYTFHSFDSGQQLNEYPFAHIVTLSGYTKKLLHQLGVAKPILVVRPFIPS